jgi:hypothetical protein
VPGLQARRRSDARPGDHQTRPGDLAGVPGLRGLHESISRSQNPTLEKLVLNDITIEYHETLMAAAGLNSAANKRAAKKAKGGQPSGKEDRHDH